MSNNSDNFDYSQAANRILTKTLRGPFYKAISKMADKAESKNDGKNDQPVTRADLHDIVNEVLSDPFDKRTMQLCENMSPKELIQASKTRHIDSMNFSVTQHISKTLNLKDTKINFHINVNGDGISKRKAIEMGFNRIEKAIEGNKMFDQDNNDEDIYNPEIRNLLQPFSKKMQIDKLDEFKFTQNNNKTKEFIEISSTPPKLRHINSHFIIRFSDFIEEIIQ